MPAIPDKIKKDPEDWVKLYEGIQKQNKLYEEKIVAWKFADNVEGENPPNAPIAQLFNPHGYGIGAVKAKKPKKYGEIPYWIENPNGHHWLLNPNASVNMVAFEEGGHSGAICILCEYRVCKDCQPFEAGVAPCKGLKEEDEF